MSAAKDGGPAFPRSAFTTELEAVGHDGLSGAGFTSTSQSGMSLRDYFAGQVMIGILASPVAPDADGRAVTSHTAYAATAYLWADAMIAAREAKP